MEEKLISVILPAYNAEAYLKEAIDSILVQSYSNFELVIVNDASPYDLDSIIGSYHDSRIRYYKNEKGCGALHVVENWNKCLELAEGDYVICMGDDDKLLPNCLMDYYQLILNYPDVELFHSMTEIINEKSEVMYLQQPRPIWESALSMIWWRWNGREQFIGDWLFKTSSLRSRGGYAYFDFAWCSDDFSAIYAALEKGVVNTQTPGFQYRRNSLTITNNVSNTKQKLACRIKSLELYKEILKRKPEGAVDVVYHKLLSDNLYKFHDKFIAVDLAAELRHNHFRVFSWLFERKQYHISLTVLFKAFYHSIR